MADPEELEVNRRRSEMRDFPGENGGPDGSDPATLPDDERAELRRNACPAQTTNRRDGDSHGLGWPATSRP